MLNFLSVLKKNSGDSFIKTCRLAYLHYQLKTAIKDCIKVYFSDFQEEIEIQTKIDKLALQIKILTKNRGLLISLKQMHKELNELILIRLLENKIINKRYTLEIQFAVLQNSHV